MDPSGQGWVFLLAGLVCLVIFEVFITFLGFITISQLFFIISQLLIIIGLTIIIFQNRQREKQSQGSHKQDGTNSDTVRLLDPLTRLPTKRQFEAKLKIEYEKALRSQKPVSILAVGIDDFNKIINQFGQSGVNTVLQHVAWILEKSIRSMDIVAHTNAEDFHILLIGIDIQEANFVAERILKRIEETPVRFDDHDVHVTCSIGLTMFPTKETSPLSSLVKMQVADTHLAFAHQKGGNRIISG